MLISIVWYSFFFITVVSSLKYPNEIVDTPIVICEEDKIIIKIKTSMSNPSNIYVDGRENDMECVSRNQNKIEVAHDKCGVVNEKTEQPNGSIRRLCIFVQLHPLFVTESDRSYCAQCVYADSHVMKDIESTLDISEAPPLQLSPQFDAPVMPKCNYSIRKQGKDGPPVQYASIGDSVFHVWSCDGNHNGILVQNCHVEDGQGNKILIIDQNGCGIDHYVMDTPIYNGEQSIAFQETHVFKFAQRTVTRFICQIKICMKGDDCKRLSPPEACPSLEERFNEDPDKGKVFADEIHPPASMPSDLTGPNGDTSVEFVRRAPAKGSIYYGVGYNPKRHRREILINTAPRSPKQFVMKNGYPEMEMVGELRVFENPQDVEYYESQRSSASATSSVCESQSSTLFFCLLVTALVVLSILLISLFLLVSSRIRSGKNNSMHFAQ
ncbi:ZP domain-containing protein [Caenorhabditis elegans]|uniref:ZP domain-containing protein n=1 Tax=Caenorhabditis elegans TaxID=6239 RepID=Q19304_CAEEL|nr:ZP domain-containing protein [Caenorhabditis elegans]CCD69170.1 ZP domain-containing protein [Caenorhabditis elegans]|eukprot:NP_495472.1 CUTiclin-Like [Caenorhabditis elegans]